jgi:PAS domain S-box-containing protein
MKDAGATVLVVNDQTDDLSFLTRLLEKEGYRVQPADNGKLALISVAAQPPDLILLGLQSPEMDGFEVCRRLLASEPARPVPIIFISVSRESQDWIQGLSLGAVDFVCKPFQEAELLARVRTHVELGRLRASLEAQVAQRTAELKYAIEQMRMEVVERRRSDQALRESEERFRQIANAAPVIIWTSDADNRIDFRNDYAASFTGHAPDAEGGDGWMKAVHPADRVRQRETLAQMLRTRQEFQFEYRVHRADGKCRDMLDLGTPRFLADGDFAGFIGIVFDLTDIKNVQAREFRERNLENLRVLTAGIAHDFNSLIGAIFGEADLALGDMAPDTPGRDSVERIESVATRAADIVRLLLAYVGDVSEVNVAEPVNLSSVVQEIVPHLKGPRFHRTEIRTNLAPNLPSIRVNLSQIRLVLLNMIINAVEAIEQERGLVTISTALVEIRGEAAGDRRSLADGAYVRLDICDNGRGMPDDVRNRMFNPYFTTKCGCRGLGLAAAEGIIRSHHGNITVRSLPGEGSTFEVLLPVPGGTPAANE